MGTRWRGLLAPINEPTGDGRRFARGAVTWRELPLGLKWQRVDSAGHDDSVLVGSTDTMNIGSVEQAIANNWISAEAVSSRMSPQTVGVWGAGDVFDDVDAATMPRLAQDVAEATLLLKEKVIGVSVDAGAAAAVLVRIGSDTPLTGDELDELMWEAYLTGQDPPIELLFTQYEIAAATLVAIPAFAEARPFELFDGDAAPADSNTQQGQPALVAALTAAAGPVLPMDAFTVPPADTVHALQIEDRGDGWQRIYGYVAQASSCHLEFRGMCVTPPESSTDYALFHRFVQNGDDGPIAVGRITTGGGRVGTGCSCCPGKDDHACSGFSLSRAIEHYDQLRTVAWVRATDTPLGIWVCGIIPADVSTQDRAVLRRQMFSGDWRDSGGNLELIEVLALAKEKPGFPVPIVTSRAGRPFSLTAAGGVIPGREGRATPQTADAPATPTWSEFETLLAQFGRSVRDAFRLKQPTDDASLDAVTAAAEQTGAMVALVPTPDDAARLAVQGGEDQRELHLTLMYLGEAADITDQQRQAIVDGLTRLTASMVPIQARGFAVSVFNPDAAADSTSDQMPAVVLTVGGEDLATVHAATEQTVGDVYASPDQYSPWAPHVTLAYTADFGGLLTQLTDRVGPITFDRVRVAFAGAYTDLPLGTAEPAPASDAAASLAADLDQVLASLGSGERAREAGRLAREIEETADVLR